jgi:hypothetical protein
VIGTWFKTEYDEPRAVFPLPVEVESGQDEVLTILDQVVRGGGIVGRVTGDFGSITLNVAGSSGRSVHVRADLQLDEMGVRWWSDRVRPPRNDPERPRLVLLRAQGKVQGAALLARKQGWRGAESAKATIEFDLPAEELTGMLVIELAEPQRPSWAGQRVSARSALGLRFDRLSVREEAAPAAAAPTWTGCDLAIVQPGGPSAFRLDLNSVSQAPPVPRSPSSHLTRRKPARAAFKLGRISRRVMVRAGAEALPDRPSKDLDVLAADLTTGEPVAVEVVGRQPHSLDVRLEMPPEGPVLIGLSTAHPGLSCRIVPVQP